jgi:hypothetical protein
VFCAKGSGSLLKVNARTTVAFSQICFANAVHCARRDQNHYEEKFCFANSRPTIKFWCATISRSPPARA